MEVVAVEPGLVAGVADLVANEVVASEVVTVARGVVYVASEVVDVDVAIIGVIVIDDFYFS